MAGRLKPGEIMSCLGQDYKEGRDLSFAVRSAEVVLSRLKLAAADASSPLTEEDLCIVGMWLAAHFYVQSDQTESSRSTAGRSSSFTGQYGMGLDNSKYGQTAKMMDSSGMLQAVFSSTYTVAGGFWMGLPERDQTTYEERN